MRHRWCIVLGLLALGGPAHGGEPTPSPPAAAAPTDAAKPADASEAPGKAAKVPAKPGSPRGPLDSIDALPRFPLPSQLKKPPGLSLTGPAGSAVTDPDDDPDATFVMPALFLFRPRGLHAPTRGYHHRFTPGLLYAREDATPREIRRDGSVAQPRAPMLFVSRGFFHIVENPVADWSGAEFSLNARLTDGFEATFLLHHEYRRGLGDFGSVSGVARLPHGLHFRGQIGAGSGAAYLPSVLLEAEIGGILPYSTWLHWTFSLSGSFWSQRRELYDIGISATLWLTEAVALELAQQSRIVMSETGRIRAAFSGNVGVVWGVHGHLMGETGITVGNSPRYTRDGASFDTPLVVSVDGEAGVRYWIGPDYGFGGHLSGGGQLGRFYRIGFDLSLFVEL